MVFGNHKEKPRITRILADRFVPVRVIRSFSFSIGCGLRRVGPAGIRWYRRVRL